MGGKVEVEVIEDNDWNGLDWMGIKLIWRAASEFICKLNGGGVTLLGGVLRIRMVVEVGLRVEVSVGLGVICRI